ncbi:MAG: hypothetical protein U9R19_03810, partial [Bacteroidota bacterium]|nr:hypothetical protein [Bacteroidota bacterium]
MKSQFDKNKEEARISEDDIKSYLEGKMDTAAMYNLECKLEDDCFGAAAMEGYEKHPEAINDFDNLKSAFHTKLPDRKNSFWQRYGLYLSAAAVVVFIVSSIALIYFLQPSPTQIGQNIEKT